jgi:hypothetical protein
VFSVTSTMSLNLNSAMLLMSQIIAIEKRK